MTRPIRIPSVESSIITIIEEQFNFADVAEVTTATTIEQLEMDSLDVVEFVMELEDELDILIPDEYVESWGTSIRDIVDGMEALIEGRNLDAVNNRVLRRMEQEEEPQRWQDVGF